MALTKAHNRMIAGAPVNVLDFGATGNGVTDDSASIQSAFDESRNIKMSEVEYIVNTPIKVRQRTKFEGFGKLGAATGATNNQYGGMVKNSPSTVTITNPEQPTQVVDCLFYSDGQWENGIYPQNFTFKSLSASNTTGTTDSAFFYKIQGSGCNFEDLSIYGFDWAYNSYETWSDVFKSVVTSGKFGFNRGTGATLIKCSATNGYYFDSMVYSDLTTCSSDGGVGPSYSFINCSGVVLNGCGSEAKVSGDNNTGYAIDFNGNNRSMTVNGFVNLAGAKALEPAFSFEQGDNVIFNGGNLTAAATGTGTSVDNYDCYLGGDAIDVTFNEFTFNNGTRWNPKLRFASGVTDANVFVYAGSRRRRYFSDGSGSTFYEDLNESTATNANGTYVRYPSGIMKAFITLPKTGFVTGSSLSTVVQGINWYRSSVVVWSFPITFSATPQVTVTPRSGTTGVRFIWPRLDTTSASLTASGQIQLNSVEDFLVASNAYVNLQDVYAEAIGFWDNKTLADNQ